MQTRKFVGVDIAKISIAIETIVQEYGLTTTCAHDKSNSIKWCDANRTAGIYTGGEAIPNISFLINADAKQKATILRVSYTQTPQNQSQSASVDFYNKFFRKMGDILFIEAQKIDLQEIN